MNVAYRAHYNAPRLYQEFSKDDRSIPRFVTAVAGANVLATLIYIITAVSGYITFGDSTEGDILKNFNGDYQPAQVARLALALDVMCTFPLAHHSVRSGIIALAYNDEFDTDTLPMQKYIPLTVGMVISIVSLGVAIEQVEVVLAYNGGIFGSCITYISPALIYSALHMKPVDSAGPESKTLLCPGHQEIIATFEMETHASLSAVLSWMFAGGGKGSRALALLLTWGVTTGILGVVMTIFKMS